jgi:hypothetical protein
MPPLQGTPLQSDYKLEGDQKAVIIFAEKKAGCDSQEQPIERNQWFVLEPRA